MDAPNNLLIQGVDGRFAERDGEADITSPHRGHSAALVDLDGHGRVDLVVVNRRAPLRVWRNTIAETGHWLAVSLTQPAPNQHAVGGHASGSAGPQHFGLGEAA